MKKFLSFVNWRILFDILVVNSSTSSANWGVWPLPIGVFRIESETVEIVWLGVLSGTLLVHLPDSEHESTHHAVDLHLTSVVHHWTVSRLCRILEWSDACGHEFQVGENLKINKNSLVSGWPVIQRLPDRYAVDLIICRESLKISVSHCRVC